LINQKSEESTGDKLLSEMKYHISNPTIKKKKISSMSNVYECAACTGLPTKDETLMKTGKYLILKI